jgi:hypothetical protein
MDKFPGFPIEGQFWQFPTCINGYVHILSDSQFKVLWYILRHTYGYQKTSDYISISQIMSGIKRYDNSVIDSGTGLKSQKAVWGAIRKLEVLGFIVVERKSGRTNFFKPCINHGGLPRAQSMVVPRAQSMVVPRAQSTTQYITNIKPNTYIVELTQRLVTKYNELFSLDLRYTDKKRDLVKARRKTYSEDELNTSLLNCSQSKFHRGENDRGWVATFDYIFRNDEQVDKLLNLKKKGDDVPWLSALSK